MLKKKIIIFNVLSLLVTLGASVAMFPYSAVSNEKFKAQDQSKSVEEFDSVDLGTDYGKISVAELMGYYMENPPLKESSSSSAPVKQHFGGC